MKVTVTLTHYDVTNKKTKSDCDKGGKSLKQEKHNLLIALKY